MSPFAERSYFILFWLTRGLAGQLGVPFLSFHGHLREVKFGWWENWVVLHRAFGDSFRFSFSFVY